MEKQMANSRKKGVEITKELMQPLLKENEREGTPIRVLAGRLGIKESKWHYYRKKFFGSNGVSRSSNGDPTSVVGRSGTRTLQEENEKLKIILAEKMLEERFR